MSRGRKLLKVINQNKPFLAVFSLFLSLLLIVGSTYSWITYSDEKINPSKPNAKKLSATIDEAFIPNLQWMPGKVTANELSVENNGQMPAIVRISLYEFFAQFELDTADGIGNGKRKVVNRSSGADIQIENAATWAKGNTYKVASGKYYTISDIYKGDKTNPKTAYSYKGNRTVDGLKYVTIQFNDKDIYDIKNKPASGIKNYWYFSDGYFYYSEVLKPKEKTKQLIRSVVLEKNVPNKYKGSLYQLIPVMEAHDITKSLLGDWKVTSNSYVETMYRGKVH